MIRPPPLTVPVTAGGIYGVFANESTADSDSYYGYKYNVWFHETALTAAASETFTATVYQMGTGVAPAEGVQIFCGGELLGRTAADGTFACTLTPQASTSSRRATATTPTASVSSR